MVSGRTWFGPGFVGTSGAVGFDRTDALNYIDQVQKQVQTLDKDQKLSRSLGPGWHQGEWDFFVEGPTADPNQPLSARHGLVPSPFGWNPYRSDLSRLQTVFNADQVVSDTGEYQRRLKELQDAFTTAGGISTQPPIDVGFVPPPPGEGRQPVVEQVKAVLWPVAIIALFILAMRYMPTPSPSREEHAR
jgi:hypothetical protein